MTVTFKDTSNLKTKNKPDISSAVLFQIQNKYYVQIYKNYVFEIIQMLYILPI